MKIAYILPNYWPAIGGCEIHTHELVIQMSSDHDIQVITQINSQEDKIRAEERSPFYEYLWFGVTAFAPTGGPWKYDEGGARVHLLRVGWFSRRWLYPLVRYHHRMENLSFNLLKAFFMRKMDSKLRKCEIIHSVNGGVSFLSHAALDAARMKGIPFVFTPILHLIDNDWIKQYSESRRRGLQFDELPELKLNHRGWHDRYWLEVCKKADALITMTQFEKDFFISKGIEKERIFPVGVGPILSEVHDGRAFRQEHGLGDRPMVLFLGRNHLIKGIRELLEAAGPVWKKHPDVEFVFIGPLEGEARSVFETHKDSHIHVLGTVSRKEKTSALEACDIMCLPSLNESFGGVFLEAWYFGKPVIGGDIPPVRELVKDGCGGFLVLPEPTEIAEKICRLIESRDLSENMGEWGRKRVLEEYSWKRIAEKISNVYGKLVSGELPLNPRRFEDDVL
ncbi:MAG: glycosyltransferase family 4 protein [Candidatus Glassbacteria bacterium]